MSFGRHEEEGRLIYGYRVENDEVVFEFDPRQYAEISATVGAQPFYSLRNAAIEEVSVAGEFNE